MRTEDDKKDRKKQGRKMRTEKDNEYSKDYEDRRG